MTLLTNASWLPLVFAGLIGLAVLVYAVLDGYDLGVGILMKFTNDETERNKMIASIGPFWDANETWLVLGIGLLLVAFPVAYSIVLRELYMPFTVMLFSLMMRGVAFDFRTKAKTEYREFWNNVFFYGSLLMSFSQGYILGKYIIGFETGLYQTLFAIFVGLSVVSAYSLIGASWLIMKSESFLQKKAILWARKALFLTALGIVIISLITPIISLRIFNIWFVFPNVLLLGAILFITIALIGALQLLLRNLPQDQDKLCWLPFTTTIGIFILCFHGLAYSFYPYIIPGRISVYDTITSNESLAIMLIGALIVLPFLIAYTAFAYKIFYGKTKDLSYN
ncbi:MAG: cytochrome BD ubiquinol oxidase subunit II [Legionellales bacterium RIFCSPHIGHO2_12_FULL_35_11]|nr:MAG: cytochrome BD ubiquinol oxidase subunit II [Legionellales bacterium RIFCSPHIGHO2_12_FULL_35_11]